MSEIIMKNVRNYFTVGNPLLVVVFFFFFQNSTCYLIGEIYHIGRKFQIIKNEWVHIILITYIPWNLFTCGYYQGRVNLCSIGVWYHAPYTSKKLLLNWLYLCCEHFTILILSFIHNFHDDLPQVSIKDIGFTI